MYNRVRTSTPDPRIGLREYRGDGVSHLSSIWQTLDHCIGRNVYRLDGSQPPVTAAFTYSLYQRLLSWTNDLSSAILRNEHGEGHVLVFRYVSSSIFHANLWSWYLIALSSMCFHFIILGLFHPLLPSTYTPTMTAYQYHPHVSSPTVISNASLRQLKSLLLIFENTSPSATLTLTWHGALLYAANGTLKNTTDPVSIVSTLH